MLFRSSELFREAFRAYRAEQIRAVFDKLHALAKAGGGKGYIEEDIERFVDEDRTERWAAKKSGNQ